jgi:hypothetical protein
VQVPLLEDIDVPVLLLADVSGPVLPPPPLAALDEVVLCPPLLVPCDDCFTLPAHETTATAIAAVRAIDAQEFRMPRC